MDSTPSPVPVGERILAALGPKMLEMARGRSLGAHPYCITVEHTAIAREILGAGSVLAPEVKVVLEPDRGLAYEIARRGLDRYLKLPNYANNLVRLGWRREDLENGGSDALVDALVAIGSPEAIAERVDAHLGAGADHAAIQVLSATPREFPITGWRQLAEILLN